MITGSNDEDGEHLGNADRPSKKVDERRCRWAHLIRNQHYEPVIFDVLKDELPKYTNSRVIDPTDLVAHVRECALILASAPQIFYSAVEGNLVTRIIHDTELQAEYATMQQRAHHQPSIYIHLLADDYGIAPTPNQYLIIRDMIQNYLSEGESEHAYQIDIVTPPSVSLETSTEGYRKYLHTLYTKRSTKRISTLKRLCAGITARRLNTLSSLHNTPFPYPPSEVGYALNAHKRLAQHRARHSSNYVLNLVEDICTYLCRTGVLKQQFKMHQFIVYLIFRPSQAAVAEILVSGLLQCWVEGGGFNACAAGRSVASSRRVGVEDWMTFGMASRQVSSLCERMRMMRERAEVWRRALDWEEEDDKGVDVNAKQGRNGRDITDIS